MLVLVRTLATDKNLARRFGTELKIGVLHEGERPKAEAATALGVFQAMDGMTIGGLSLESAAVPWSDAEALSTALTEGSIDVIFVPASLEAAAAAVPSVSQEQKRATITRHRAYVEAGLGLGVEVVEGQPRIVVNLDASRAEGAAYPSQILRVADVIRPKKDQ